LKASVNSTKIVITSAKEKSMKMKIIILSVCIFVLMLFSGTAVFAQYDITDATQDLESIAITIAKTMGESLGSISFLCEPVGYAFTPHFEFGVATGLAFIPLKGISEIVAVDFPLTGGEHVPIPAIGGHGKFSIRKLEFGGKIAGIPDVNINDQDLAIQVSNIIIGGKVRYNLVSFKKLILKGGVSVGGLYEYMHGEFNTTANDTQDIDVDNNGSVDGQLITDAGLVSEWSGHTLGAEGQANFQLLFFNFFAGTRLSKTFGKAEAGFDGNTTLVDTSGLITPHTDQLISVSVEEDPDGIDAFLFGGIEIKITALNITAKGSYNLNGDAFTLDGGIRLQF
jgi:hypothetical protein